MNEQQNNPGGDDALNAVFLFVSARAGCGRHFIQSRSRVASVVYSRALAGLLLERLGWSRRATAEALGMKSHSSLVELLDTYRRRRDIGLDLNHADAVLVVGNSTVAESEAAV